MLSAEVDRRESFVDVLASLAAAISLLERGGKKAAASDKIFGIMLDDYQKSLERGRAAIAASETAGTVPHDWCGGNDSCYCRRCGLEYDYHRESQPEGACPRRPMAVGTAPREADAAEYRCPKCGAQADERWDCCEAHGMSDPSTIHAQLEEIGSVMGTAAPAAGESVEAVAGWLYESLSHDDTWRKEIKRDSEPPVAPYGGKIRNVIPLARLQAPKDGTDALAARVAELEADKDYWHREAKDYGERLERLNHFTQVKLDERADQIAVLQRELAESERQVEYWKQLDHIHLQALNEANARLAGQPDALAGSAVGDGANPDDKGVDRFAVAMKAKLYEAWTRGRHGWDDKTACTEADLSRMLREHVEKGDPVDVANFAMMLHQRGERIAADALTAHPPVTGATSDEPKGGAE